MPVLPASSCVSHNAWPVALSSARIFLPPPFGGVRDVDLVAFRHEQQRLRHERRGADRLAERRQVERLQLGMIARAVAVRAPSTSCSPRFRSIAVMRPYGGFTSGRPRGPWTSSRVDGAIAKVGLLRIAGNQVGDERVGHRRHVEHAGLGIERRAGPIRAADRSRQLNRALQIVRAVALDRRRREHRPSPVALEDRRALRRAAPA